MEQAIIDKENDYWYGPRKKLITRYFSGSVYLDIGCNNGFMLAAVPAGSLVYGVDLDQAAVNQAENNLTVKNIKHKLFCQDASFFIPELAGKIDCLICTDILEHLSDDITVLENIYQYLKKDGRLILSVPAVKWLYNKRDEKVGHYRRYSKKEITAKVKSVGLKVEKIRYWNFLFLPVVFLARLVAVKDYNKREMSKKSLFRVLIKKILELETIMPIPVGLTVLIIAKK